MMKTRKIILLAASLMLANVSIAFAGNFDQYNKYLSKGRANNVTVQQQQQKPRTSYQQPNTVYEEQEFTPYQSVSADGNFYVQGQPAEYIPLANQNSKQGESYLLPGETRVPKELAPLLTERLTPRQGLAVNGGTGSTLVPSPGVLEPNKSAVGVHLQMFDLMDNLGKAYTDQDYFDTVISCSWGIEDGLEVGFDKTMDNQDRFDIEEPFYLNFKYQVPGNVTLGGSFNCSSGYHSVWAAAGVPVAWFGVGGNFGVSDYKFSFSNEPGKYHGKMKRAKYGGYNFDTNKGTGHADEFFFFLGGLVPLNDYLKFAYDFNGDKFSLGFRFTYQNIINVNVSYVSEGDYDNLNYAISHKKYTGCIFGASVLF